MKILFPLAVVLLFGCTNSVHDNVSNENKNITPILDSNKNTNVIEGGGMMTIDGGCPCATGIIDINLDGSMKEDCPCLDTIQKVKKPKHKRN